MVEAPRANGKRRRKVRKGFQTKKEAETALAALLTELDRGTFVKPSELTVEMWMEQWLEISQLRVKPSTLASYEAICRLHVNPGIGATKLQELDLTAVEIFYGTLAHRLSAKSVRNVHATLRRALSDAEKRGLIRANPADGAFQQRVPKPEMRVWDASQLSTFLASISGHRFENLFNVAAFTGLRRGELIALRWKDIENGAIVVRRSVSRAGRAWVETEPKSGKVRTIDLDLKTVAVLEMQRRLVAVNRLKADDWADMDLVFAHERSGRHLDGDVVSQGFQKAVKASGLPSHRFHGLRHVHATVMLRAGVPAHVVSQRLGHHSVGFTLDTYAWVMDGQQREAADLFAEALAGP